MWCSRSASRRACVALVFVLGSGVLLGGCFDELVNRTACTTDDDCYEGERCLENVCHVSASDDARADGTESCMVCVRIASVADEAPIVAAQLCPLPAGQGNALSDQDGVACFEGVEAAPSVEFGISASGFDGTTEQVDLSACSQRHDLNDVFLAECTDGACADPCGAM